MYQLQSADAIRCQYCEEASAVFLCVPCRDEMCPRCKIFHIKSNVPLGHSIIRLRERSHQTYQVKMCEIHSSKEYEACCEDCQVPVCEKCIQDVHVKHAIGKIQDLYEKQKAETIEELYKMKAQWKSEIRERINYLKNGEIEMKTNHENVRDKMKNQAQEFIDLIRGILKEALCESKKDEQKNLKEISEYKADAERFEENLDRLIGKFETLTESIHPADLLLYRKQNPEAFKQLKLPSKIDVVMPSFTVGLIDKFQNKYQFGNFITGRVRFQTSRDISLQLSDATCSAGSKQPFKKVLGYARKICEKNTGRSELYHVSCLDDKAYISGRGCNISLIDKLGTLLDTFIPIYHEPSGLAVMPDGSLIYSDYKDSAIYRQSLDKQKTKLTSTGHRPRGLCCTRSGDILVTMYKRVERYSSSGRKIQVFEMNLIREGLSINPCFVSENINGDICISDWSINDGKVVVLNKSGNFRFIYDGKVRESKDEFKPIGVATDSLGHILIADNANNSVHLISQDGEFLSFILTKDMITKPRGISIDSSDKLWVVERISGFVKVFQYLS
ncbi:E3 ubiquitin-protein ligase TRIM71-like [Saccostrea cucullata]|uniref:E3 ubiquitin-protein ligase TRIM71-like n=1 Tax=Saccostrea cuccullata TaxID=36930 RepID=UPI002ED2A67A